jgi:hypothetical protein
MIPKESHTLLDMWLAILAYCDDRVNFDKKEFNNRMTSWDRAYKYAARDKDQDIQGGFHALLAADNRRWAETN